MISLALIFESKSRTKLKAYNRSNLPKKNQSKNRTHRRRCLKAEGTFTLILVRETDFSRVLEPIEGVLFFLRVLGSLLRFFPLHHL